MSKPIQITVGGTGQYDPAAGSAEYINSSLAGSEYYISRSGAGIMPYSTYQPYATGGFALLGGLTFEDGDIWFVTITASNSEAATNSSYTNGFNFSRVINAFLPRLGFRQPTIAAYAILDNANKQSISGRYYDDFHALVRVKNIKDLHEDAAISNDDFNAYLASLKKSVIMRALNGVLNITEQIERVLLYDAEDGIMQMIENSHQFVGYEICLPSSDEFSVQIESAVLLFDQDITFNLYLFKDGKKAPVASRSVTAIANEETVVNFTDMILNYIGETTKGGTFYFGYFQDDLGSAKAISQQVDEWNDTYCFSAESITSNKITGELNFERQHIAETSQAYGLNLEISSFRDHTNAVVKKAHLFDELIGLQMAWVVLETILYSTASNATERVLKDQMLKAGLQLEMNGAVPAPDSPHITSLRTRIDRELKRVRQEFYSTKKSVTYNVNCED